MRRKRRIDITNDEDRHTQQVPHAGPSNSKSTKEDGRKVKFAQEVFAREASKADSDEDNGFVGDDDDDEGEEEGWQKEEKGNPSVCRLSPASSMTASADLHLRSSCCTPCSGARSPLRSMSQKRRRSVFWRIQKTLPPGISQT